MDLIEKAVTILMRDGIVVYPTETVYGLGADAFSDEAIYRIYEAKHRPLGMPVSIAVADFDMLAAVAHVEPWMETFIQSFLPGPVTVVLAARNCVPGALTGGTGMIGIRIPAHPLAQQLIEQFDSPVTATSANLHGAKEPQIPEDCTVHYDLLLDGGKLPGTPSTVVDLPAKKILRAGAEIDKIAKFLVHL